MKYMRVGAREVPEKGRSAWARGLLSEAMAKKVCPVDVPLHRITSFTAGLPDHVHHWIEQMSRSKGVSTAQVSAGLIAAIIEQQQTDSRGTNPSTAQVDGLEMVRPILQPLVEKAWENAEQGKAIFFEASTGTGKGRALMYLAAKALTQSKTVVVSAPLPIVKQLIGESLTAFKALKVNPVVNVLLGRANFIDPQEALAWAQETQHNELTQWIQAGAPPQSEYATELSDRVGVQLSYLAEEALKIAEDLPLNTVLLEADAPESCPANRVYLALKRNANDAQLIFCSHHLLAAETKQRQLGMEGYLPKRTSLLLIDEAHLLEQAFGAIFSHQVHIHSVMANLERSRVKGKRQVLALLDQLGEQIAMLAQSTKDRVAQLAVSETPQVMQVCQQLFEAIKALKYSKKELNESASISRTLTRAKHAFSAVASGYGVARHEQTAVRRYPVLTVGRSSLTSPMELLWEQCDAIVMCSATLYTDKNNAGLMRWKLNVPKTRAVFLPSVRPDWVVSPVRYHVDRVSSIPDESPAWHEELSQKVLEIALKARGGTLVLVTAYETVKAMEELLSAQLNDRLIIQSPKLSASAAAEQFKQHPSRPVWVGVGSAWTGIDLSDPSVEPGQDNVLSDLVVARLPFGINKTLTHQRRVQMAGPGAGGIEMQEALWLLRQGIGRLVRREGVPIKNLWVLDSRIDTGKTYYANFRRLLAQYPSADKE